MNEELVNENQLNEEWKQKTNNNIFLPLITVILNNSTKKNPQKSHYTDHKHVAHCPIASSVKQ